MQLDQTHVVIRLRSLSEIGDLAMVMIRRYPSALVVGFLIGALPWAIANAGLLSQIPIHEARMGLNDEEATAGVFRYLNWMALLVFLQTPIAGVLATIYVGQAVFEHRPTWSSVFREARRHWWPSLWALGIKRFAVPTMIILALRWQSDPSPFWDVVVPVAIVIIVALIRSSRPFIPEILLLEQCPLRGRSKSTITVSKRSKLLHRPMSSELGGRFLAVSLAAGGLSVCVLYSLLWIRGITFDRWDFMSLSVLLVLYPLALWTVAGVTVLIRLLNYLDTRIRLEGWEVELAVRAEALRQFGKDATETADHDDSSTSKSHRTTQANTDGRATIETPQRGRSQATPSSAATESPPSMPSKPANGIAAEAQS